MDHRRLQNVLRFGIRVLCVLAVVLVLLHLIADIAVPGLLPLVMAALFAGMWGLFKLRGQIPARIYTFIYFLIVILNLITAVKQITG